MGKGLFLARGEGQRGRRRWRGRRGRREKRERRGRRREKRRGGVKERRRWERDERNQDTRSGQYLATELECL